MKRCKKAVVMGVLVCWMVSGCRTGGDGWEELAQRPPMGWNSWNTFRLDINEKVVRDIADMLVELGFKDAGYEYIVIDDGWQVDRMRRGISW